MSLKLVLSPMRKISIKIAGLLFLIVLIISCRGDIKDIEETIISERGSFYYIDFKAYPAGDKTLPIGVFDSGTGGLTVLKSILDFDQHQNETHAHGSDSVRDFLHESFIYFGDLANMPYGNYARGG